jgi:hypothetical protein
MSSCSIESVSGDAVSISTTGTGLFGFVAIAGLQVGLYSNNTGRAVKVTAATNGAFGTAGSIALVTIDGIAVGTDGTARAAVELTNTDRVTLGDMSLGGFNARYTSSGDTNTIDAGTPPGYEYVYTTITSPVTVTGTSEGGATTIITSGSFTSDGAPVLVEVNIPRLDAQPNSVGNAFVVDLYLDSTTQGRLMTETQSSSTTLNWLHALHGTARITPSAGSHTVAVKMWMSNASDGVTVQAGAGGSGNSRPMHIRVTKV